MPRPSDLKMQGGTITSRYKCKTDEIVLCFEMPRQSEHECKVEQLHLATQARPTVFFNEMHRRSKQWYKVEQLHLETTARPIGSTFLKGQAILNKNARMHDYIPIYIQAAGKPFIFVGNVRIWKIRIQGRPNTSRYKCNVDMDFFKMPQRPKQACKVEQLHPDIHARQTGFCFELPRQSKQKCKV